METTTVIRPDLQLTERLGSTGIFSYEEARHIMRQIAGGTVNPSQVAAFITAFMMREATAGELAGFRDALLEQVLPLDLPGADQAIDIVGTGGDGKGTFNISTLSAFVVAGAGYRVIKHGNHGVTSVSGSSDVLRYLGCRFTADGAQLRRSLEYTGICFLHAPLFHPGIKRVAQIRQELGIRSLFNLLGPLINPARPGYLLLGAGSAATARVFHYLLQGGSVRYKVVYSLDGYDEISLTGPFRLFSSTEERVIRPESLSFKKVMPEALLAGKDIQAAAALFTDILYNRATAAQTSVVAANSAMAIQCREPELSMEDCVAMAHDSLRSGKALQTFKKTIETH